MPEEFKKRRGYDLAPWLPALTGKIIGSAEVAQRFLWDYRRTLADLMAESHYGVIQEYAHQHQMGLESEASGIGMPTVADQLLCKKYTDIPMGEFWTSSSRDTNIDDTKEAASAAHIYGRTIAGAESFTSTAASAGWKNDPYSLKAPGDEEFCLGINRYSFHRYAHQPWLDRQPGMSMGPWGINFERTNTWWEPGAAWIKYITRCQYLLQQGQFQAHLCYYYGEGAPVCVHHHDLTPAPPGGYDYDVCNADVLLNLMTVEDGRVALPSGMRYRVLVLPDTDRMTLPVLKKIEALVSAGATVYGPRPSHSPSLPVLKEGSIGFTAFKSGAYELSTGSDSTLKADVPPLPQPQELAGPWQVTFPPKLGAPERATFDHLISWTDSPDERIDASRGRALPFTRQPRRCFRRGCLGR